VMAVFSGQKGRRNKVLIYLSVTQLCALAFLGIKSIEYTSKFKEGLFPNARFNYAKGLEESHAHGAHAAASPRHEQAWLAFQAATKSEKHASSEAHGEKEIPQPQSEFSAPVRGVVSTAGLPVGSQIREAKRLGTWANFERESNKARLFFSIYFTMTGLHGVHVLIGMLLMGAMMKFYYTRRQCVEDYIPLELIGLYWHFVDIVWIFLFPLMYLIS
jgi:cytochrome c oxidase subunit III